LSNVDARVRDELRSELISMRHDLRFAGVYVTHDQQEAMALADQVAVVRSGKIVQTGSPLEIYHQPATRYVATFVGEANVYAGTVGRSFADDIVVLTDLGELVGLGSSALSGTAEAGVAVIRPERVRLTHDEPASPNRWRGVVESVIFLGGLVEHIVRLDGGQVIRSRTSDASDARQGDDVWASADIASVRVVPDDVDA
jgi:iron(III) transport system ATP-binding protein